MILSLEELQNIFDYKNELNTFIEEKIYNDTSGSEIARYFRTKKGYTSTYKDEVTVDKKLSQE